MIASLLDTDFYKWTQLQLIENRYPDATAAYDFKCRNDADLRPLQAEIREQIDALGDLRFNPAELDYLRELKPLYDISKPYLKPTFVDRLARFRFNPDLIAVSEQDGRLCIRAEGRWGDVMPFEVPVLAIVNETYFRRLSDSNLSHAWAEGEKRLRDGIAWVRAQEGWESFRFSEFGTRRRFSLDWQGRVIEILQDELPEQWIGTSNVWYAMQSGKQPVGTMAHEILQAYQALVPLSRFQSDCLRDWLLEFEGNLGVALTDVVGFDAFLRDFNYLYAKAFDGLRHDSGDPFLWGGKALDHYRKLGIDPREKVLLFSDSLDWQLAMRLHQRFSLHEPDPPRVRFGIGTFLSNNLGYPPINIVMKLVELNGLPVAKLSDSPGKEMSKDEEFKAHLRKLFRL